MSEHQPESITQAELEAYFQRRQAERNVMGGCAAEAARIVRDILAHREPEYEPGGIYEDPEGNRYLRRPGRPLLAWARIFLDGAVSECPEDGPVRPLRKLVPEGVPAAPLDHGTVLDVIEGFGRLSYHEADALAGRICNLAGGECSA